MKTYRQITLIAGGLLAMLSVGTALGATPILTDNYTATTAGTGFGLAQGVNTSINPPATRMTGSVAPNLRYYQTVTTRAPSFYDINSNRLRVSTDTSIGRFTFSANGSTVYDFAQALGSLYATPANPATYDIKISMRNDATSTARFSFALSTAEGDANNWDFAIQLYRAASANNYYTVQKRVDQGSAFGTTSTDATGDVNAVIARMYDNSAATLVSFLIRITDAGAESGNDYHSQVQVSTNNGTTWFYDTKTDGALTNGFRFDGPGRVICFDQASNGSGPVYYDSLSISSTYAPPPPTPRSWTGLGGDDNWSSSANWDGPAPVGGEALLFTGTTQQMNTNDITGLSVLTLGFNNGGFTLWGNAFSNSLAISNQAGLNVLAADMSWGTTSPKVWNITSGSELVLSNTTTVDVIGEHNVYGGGNLRQAGAFNIGQNSTVSPAFFVNEGQHIIDGGTFTSKGGYRVGSMATAAGGAQTVLTNGGTLNITATSGSIRIGDSANPNTRRLVIDHSTLLSGGAVLEIPYAAGATSEVAQVGGAVSGCPVSFNYAGVGSGTYTIKDGTLEPLYIEERSNGVARIYFDNAVLRATGAASSAFMGGLDVAEIQSGGLTLDAQLDVTIAQPLSGVGALTKTGVSTVTLTGANSYSGGTFVTAGKLVFPTGQNCAGPAQVADYTELGVLVQTPGTTATNGSLTLGSSGTAYTTLTFDLGSFSTPTAPLMKVTSLTNLGVVNINVINGLKLTTGQIVLIDYDGSIRGSGFPLFVKGSLPQGVTADLVDNQANSSIDLKITGVPGYVWTGANSSDWDMGTPNWTSMQTGTASTYLDGAPVEFRDGATRGIVNLAIDCYPSQILVSNTVLPYVWTNETHAITTSLLTKNGSGSLTRIGLVDPIGTLELNEGLYVLSNSVDGTFATVLTDTGAGTGTFVKQGPGRLAIASTNSTYDGAIVIQNGVVSINHDQGLGSTLGSTTISNGATLDLNNYEPGAEPVFVSGAGPDGQGALIDSTISGAVAVSLRDVTMLGDTTFGCPNSSGRWDIRARSSTGPGPGLRGNGYKLTKVGPGFFSIACQRTLGAATPYWRMNLGDILVSQGTLAIAESIDLGNPSASLIVSPGAKLQIYDLGLTNPLSRTITITDAGLTASGTTTDTNVLNGGMQLSGNVSFYCDQAHLFINSAIAGSGSLTFGANEPGTVLLNGVNTYTGDITVTNGTLGGTGVIAGNLIMQGGTNSPGSDGIGTLTVNGNVTLGSTIRMEVNHALSPNSDRLVANGALNCGGTLLVVLLAAPQPGDVYQLFNKGGSGVFASVILPSLAAYPGSMSWDSSQLMVNGSLKVNGTISPPTIGSVSQAGGSFSFSGTGGIEGNPYYVVTSPNVAAPLGSWVPVSSNVFGTGGSFSFSTNTAAGGPQAFFRLRVP